MLKRVLMVVGVLVALLVLVIGGIGFSVFGGLKPIVDGAELPGGARQIAQGYTSAFLFDAGDGTYALIDCLQNPGAKEVVDELARRKASPEAVTAIFLTHGHPDHIGGCQAFPKAQVYAFQGDVDPAAGKGRFKGPLPSTMDIPAAQQVKVTQVLQDGVAVQVGTLSVLPLAVPGHTGGSATFVVNGVAYMGDNATGAADGTVRPAPWIFSDDTAENRRSLGALSKRLKALSPEVKTLAFAHSGPLDGIGGLAAFEGQ